MRTRRFAAAAALAVTAATLAACGSSDSGSTGGTITLKFQSLAFQQPTVAASKKIVADWNAAHPKIQVQYIQGSWDSVHDQLVTQFQGGSAPDIIHDESADIAGFAKQGFLADLAPQISGEVKSSIPDGVWQTVSADGKIYGGPTLLQSYVVFVNTDLLKQAGVTMPTGSTLSWDSFQAMAKSLTTPKHYGVGWGLKSPTASVLSMGLNFDGKFFYTEGDKTTVKVDAAEQEVPRRIHDMIYTDKSIDPTSVSQSGGDVLPGFYAGKYAMTVQGSYAAQQIVADAKPSFHWAVLPILAGTSAHQAADPQTLSVSAQSKHVAEAGQFVNYFLAADNLAAVAQGDWLIPTSAAAQSAVAKQTGGKDGWTATLATGSQLTEAPFQQVADYPKWKDQIATPALQQYFANKIDLATLSSKLSDGWTQVGG
ncbi:MAG: multiple sugar transport system substrate-binding protein [Mycobacteriales bacterium]